MIVKGISSLGIDKPVLVDATGRLLVVIDAQTNNLNTSISNWPSYIWVKELEVTKTQPSSIIEQLYSVSLTAGTNTIVGGVVPSLLHYKLKRINFTYIGTTTGVVIRTYIIRSVVNYYAGEYRTLTSAVYYNDNYDLILNGDDRLGVQVVGATAGNSFYMFTFYERMS